MAKAKPEKKEESGDFENPKAVRLDELSSDHDPETINDVAKDVLELSRQRAQIEIDIKARQTVLKSLMEEINSTESWTLNGPGWCIPYVKPKPRRTLQQEKLVEGLVGRGVPLDTVEWAIERATKETPSTPYISVRFLEDN